VRSSCSTAKRKTKTTRCETRKKRKTKTTRCETRKKRKTKTTRCEIGKTVRAQDGRTCNGRQRLEWSSQDRISPRRCEGAHQRQLAESPNRKKKPEENKALTVRRATKPVDKTGGES
jgi:hypothetical protein